MGVLSNKTLADVVPKLGMRVRGGQSGKDAIITDLVHNRVKLKYLMGGTTNWYGNLNNFRIYGSSTESKLSKLLSNKG